MPLKLIHAQQMFSTIKGYDLLDTSHWKENIFSFMFCIRYHGYYTCRTLKTELVFLYKFYINAHSSLLFSQQN